MYYDVRAFRYVDNGWVCLKDPLNEFKRHQKLTKDEMRAVFLKAAEMDDMTLAQFEITVEVHTIEGECVWDPKS